METYEAVDGQALLAGDLVRTAEDAASLAEVVHRNGAVTRLDARTELTVDRADAGGRPRIVVTLGPGRTWHHTGPLDDPTLFEVRCPGAVLTARFASFALDCREDGSAHVTAVEGNVVVRGTASGSVALADGQRAVVDAAGVVARSLDAADVGADPWVSLNRALDRGSPLPPPVEPVDVAEPEPPAPETDAEDEPVEPEVETRAVEDEGAAPVLAGPAALPAWMRRAGVAAAVAASVAIPVVTWLTVERPDQPATTQAASTESTSTTAAPETPAATLPAEAAPAPAAVEGPAPEPTPPTAALIPSATAKGTVCRRAGSSVVYGGTLTNTGPVASGFAVDTVLITSRGARASGATATVRSVQPGQTVRWEVRLASAASGSSCETAGVRPL